MIRNLLLSLLLVLLLTFFLKGDVIEAQNPLPDFINLRAPTGLFVAAESGGGRELIANREREHLYGNNSN